MKKEKTFIEFPGALTTVLEALKMKWSLQSEGYFGPYVLSFGDLWASDLCKDFAPLYPMPLIHYLRKIEHVTDVKILPEKKWRMQLEAIKGARLR